MPQWAIDALFFIPHIVDMKDPCPPLIRRIERHLKRTGKTPSRFGREAAKSSTLIQRLRSGKVTLATIRRVTAHLDGAEQTT